MPTVYIPNKGTHDYSPAERYGDLVYLTEGAVNRYDLDPIIADIQNTLSEATASDYLIITSLSILNAISVGFFAARFGRVNLLQFRNGSYVQRTINFS